jgi:hypothetical protein
MLYHFVTSIVADNILVGWLVLMHVSVLEASYFHFLKLTALVFFSSVKVDLDPEYR